MFARTRQLGSIAIEKIKSAAKAAAATVVSFVKSSVRFTVNCFSAAGEFLAAVGLLSL